MADKFHHTGAHYVMRALTDRNMLWAMGGRIELRCFWCNMQCSNYMLREILYSVFSALYNNPSFQEAPVVGFAIIRYDAYCQSLYQAEQHMSLAEFFEKELSSYLHRHQIFEPLDYLRGYIINFRQGVHDALQLLRDEERVQSIIAANEYRCPCGGAFSDIAIQGMFDHVVRLITSSKKSS
eukprot:TRINITY_DN1269_c0_g2_i9.p1 TRINITY_DN1269_c0_g2~~TRINITY_DN1269_c0_g2_i9.p1  ORF type:complete len:181 (+),score=4.24 TRINITY_DN1269_c0_g2_i9:544-1086(+)